MAITLCNVGDAVKATEEAHAHRLSELEKLRPLADAVNGVVWTTCPEDWTVRVSTPWGKNVHVDVYLGAQQAINDVAVPLLRALAATRLFKPSRFQQADEQGFVQWHLPHRSVEIGVSLYVWLSQSMVCRRVPTGRLIPEMKIECSSTPLTPTEETSDGELREATQF
jgi:hypothetical protein